MNTNKILPLAAIITTAILWGISFISIKVSVGVLPPMTLAFIRFFIASILLIVILKWSEPGSKLAVKDYPLMSLAGVIGVTLYFYFENNGVKLTTASLSSIIIASIPILSLIADAIIFGNKLTSIKIVSVIMSIVGVYFVVKVNSAELTSGFGLGLLMMFGAALAWVAYSIFTKPLFSKYSQLSIVTYQTIFGTIALLPFSLLETTQWEMVSREIIFHVIYLALFCSALGYFLYVYALEQLGIAVSSLYINLIPVVTVITSYFWLGETITSSQMFGGTLVLSAVYLANRNAKEATQKQISV